MSLSFSEWYHYLRSLYWIKQSAYTFALVHLFVSILVEEYALAGAYQHCTNEHVHVSAFALSFMKRITYTLQVWKCICYMHLTWYSIRARHQRTSKSICRVISKARRWYDGWANQWGCIKWSYSLRSPFSNNDAYASINGSNSHLLLGHVLCWRS